MYKIPVYIVSIIRVRSCQWTLLKHSRNLVTFRLLLSRKTIYFPSFVFVNFLWLMQKIGKWSEISEHNKPVNEQSCIQVVREYIITKRDGMQCQSYRKRNQRKNILAYIISRNSPVNWWRLWFMSFKLKSLIK